jgi:hypothetical protein
LFVIVESTIVVKAKMRISNAAESARVGLGFATI